MTSPYLLEHRRMSNQPRLQPVKIAKCHTCAIMWSDWTYVVLDCAIVPCCHLPSSWPHHLNILWHVPTKIIHLTTSWPPLTVAIHKPSANKVLSFRHLATMGWDIKISKFFTTRPMWHIWPKVFDTQNTQVKIQIPKKPLWLHQGDQKGTIHNHNTLCNYLTWQTDQKHLDTNEQPWAALLSDITQQHYEYHWET